LNAHVRGAQSTTDGKYIARETFSIFSVSLIQTTRITERDCLKA
jgi:hypothetical protein